MNEEIQKLIEAAQTPEYSAFISVMAPLPYDPTLTRSGRVAKQTTVPQLSTVGTEILAAVEKEIGQPITCGSCKTYILSLNNQAEHDHDAIAKRLAAEVPMPIEYRERVTDRRERMSEVISSIVPRPNMPSKHSTQDELREFLKTPAHNWPKGWRDWPNVIEYHREFLQQELETPGPEAKPFWPSRAVLIPAGGRCTIYDKNAPQYYFWGAYAAAWVLRSHGCTLPIQFWFLPGEMEEIEFCELHARRVAATCHVVDTSGMRCVHGWQIKINAIMQSEYSQIIHLDADNIVTKDPSYLFDCETFRENAAMFWMDNPNVNDFHGRIIEHQWKRVGSDRTDRINDIETGQMVIDKVRGAKALRIIKHFADHADYWEGFNGGERGVWYGDKTSFHMGFKLTETPHHIQTWNRWNIGGFYEHCDPSGDVIFQHACHRKGHLNNGHAIRNLKGNTLIQEAVAFKGPLEFLDGSVDDALRCIAPERCFDIEPDRISRETWLDVLGRNEYLLAPTIPDDAVVIDIGANSGAFSYACLRRGAGFVLAFEPGPVAERASKNCAEFGDRFELIQRAVWRSDEPEQTLSLAPSHREQHSGSVSAVLPARGKSITVQTIDLDSVLQRFDSVHILKLDCEGAEYPILLTCSELHRVEHILGEYHHVSDAWSIDGLRRHLESIGFEIYRVVPHEKTHGNFWARRKQGPS